MIFDIENWLWKSDLGTFWQLMWTSVKVKSKKYFSFTDCFAKIKPLLTQNSTTEVTLYLTLVDMIKGACKIRFFKLHCLCQNVSEIYFRITWRKEEYGGNGYKNCLWNGEKHNILGFEHCSWTLLEGERPGLRSCFMLKAEIFSAFEELRLSQTVIRVIRESLESR